MAATPVCPPGGGIPLSSRSHDFSEGVLGMGSDTPWTTQQRAETPVSPFLIESPVENLDGESTEPPRPTIRRETPAGPLLQDWYVLPGGLTTSLKPSTRLSSPTTPLSNNLGDLPDAESTSPALSSRAGTPVSPESEELFGDILDSKPIRSDSPGANHWRDGTVRMNEPQPTRTVVVDTPLPSEYLFASGSQTTTNPSLSPSRSISKQARVSATDSSLHYTFTNYTPQSTLQGSRDGMKHTAMRINPTSIPTFPDYAPHSAVGGGPTIHGAISMNPMTIYTPSISSPQLWYPSGGGFTNHAAINENPMSTFPSAQSRNNAHPVTAMPSHTRNAPSASSARAVPPPPPPAPPAVPKEPQYRALYEFHGQSANEITMAKYELVSILQKEDNGWWLAKKSNGQQGWAPSTYLKEEESQSMPTVGNGSSNYESIYAMPVSTPDYAVQRHWSAGPPPGGPYTMNPGSISMNSAAPFTSPYPASQPTPAIRNGSYYANTCPMPVFIPNYAVQRHWPAGPYTMNPGTINMNSAAPFPSPYPGGPYMMNPGNTRMNPVPPSPSPYPASQSTPAVESNSLSYASIYPMPGITSSNSGSQATHVAEGDHVNYMGYLIPVSTSSTSALRTMPAIVDGSGKRRKLNPMSSSTVLNSAAQVTPAMGDGPRAHGATISSAPTFLPRAESPPRYSQPVFCHLLKAPLLRAPKGQEVRPTLHLWPLSQIRKFKEDLNDKEEQALCYSDNVLQDLSKALHVFEVRIGVEREKREVELCRYFVPSSRIGSKYIEIHPKDVCLGLNPAGGRIGQMEQAVTQVMFECGCSKRRGLCHGLPRIVSLLKNHLLKTPVGKLPPRPVSGEWYVGGHSKQWGLPLDEARVIWLAEAGRLGPKKPPK